MRTQSMGTRLHLKIYGNVQGVFFRASTRAKARKLGITGLVRNCSDGCVEIVAEGDEQTLIEFRNWCKEGPGQARVEKVKEEWEEAANEFERFQIIRN